MNYISNKTYFKHFIIFIGAIFNQIHSSAQVWEKLTNGEGFDDQVLCLYVDSSSNTLYAGGAFTSVDGIKVNGIAAWDGKRWVSIGDGFTSVNAVVYSITKYNDELYAGGYFTNSGSTIVNGIAKWNGSKWQALGGGISSTGIYPFVSNMIVYQDQLFVGGEFDKAGTLNALNIAKWTGNVWSTIGLHGGLSSRLYTFHIHKDELYSGGSFVFNVSTSDLQYRICKLTSTGWLNLGIKGLGDATQPWSVRAMATFKNKLVAGGYFKTLDDGVTDVNHIAQWSDSTWKILGATMPGVSSNTTDPIRAIATLNGKLYVGGTFNTADNLSVSNIAVWDDINWSSVNSSKIGGAINAMSVYNDELIIAGNFNDIDGKAIHYIAKLNESVSSILSLPNAKEVINTTPSPNPASNGISINFSKSLSRAQIILTDFTGRTMEKIDLENVDRIFVNRKSLESGIYFYYIIGDSRKIGSGKFIFQ